MNKTNMENGGLFSNPCPDEARSFFRTKSRQRSRKLMTLKQAVSQLVKNGEYLAIGGFGANRTPVAACHEIVRQGIQKMGFAGHTSTHDFEILCAGEVFDRVDIAYIIGMEVRGLSAGGRRYMESGRVKITEWTNYSLALRLKAASMGLPYIPCRNMLGTDTLKHSAAKVGKCPFTGIQVVLVPALYPDISVIHVHEADVYGNCRFRGISTADIELANATKKLIITAERIVPTEEIQRDPNQTRIPFYLVDAVCEVPYGAYPGTMPYEYFSDEEHLKEWLEVEKDVDRFKVFLQENIYDCIDHQAYIERHGGLKKMLALRHREFLLDREK
jgi:glutaconate CoA-transferase subunit A